MDPVSEDRMADFMEAQNEIAEMVHTWSGGDRVALGIAIVLNGLAHVRDTQGPARAEALLNMVTGNLNRFDATMETTTGKPKQ